MKDLELEQDLVMAKEKPTEVSKEEVEQSLKVEKMPEFNLNFEDI